MRDINHIRIILIILMTFPLLSCVSNICYNKKHKDINSTLTIKIVNEETDQFIPEVVVELYREKWPLMAKRQSILIEEKTTNESGEVQFGINNETNYRTYIFDEISNLSDWEEFRFNEIEDSNMNVVIYVK